MPLFLVGLGLVALAGLVVGCGGDSQDPEAPKNPEPDPEALPPLPPASIRACEPEQNPVAFIQPYTCTGNPGLIGRSLPVGRFYFAPEHPGIKSLTAKLIQPAGGDYSFTLNEEHPEVELMIPDGLLQYLKVGRHYSGFEIEETGFTFNLPFRIVPDREDMKSDACDPGNIPICVKR